jgi:hypothetical protein
MYVRKAALNFPVPNPLARFRSAGAAGKRPRECKSTRAAFTLTVYFFFGFSLSSFTAAGTYFLTPEKK